MKLFSFVKTTDVDRVMECGIKSDEYCAVEAEIYGIKKQCLLAFLSPYDSPLINDDSYMPLKIDLQPETVVVAEGVFRESGSEELYEGSFVKLAGYTFGSFRKPECLVPGSVLPDAIEKYNKTMDEPLLYTNSEELYIDSMFAKFTDEIPGFKEQSLAAFFNSKRMDGVRSVKEGKYTFYAENGEVRFISRG